MQLPPGILHYLSFLARQDGLFCMPLNKLIVDSYILVYVPTVPIPQELLDFFTMHYFKSQVEGRKIVCKSTKSGGCVFICNNQSGHDLVWMNGFIHP